MYVPGQGFVEGFGFQGEGEFLALVVGGKRGDWESFPCGMTDAIESLSLDWGSC